MTVQNTDVLRADARFLFNSATAVQNVFHLRNDGAAIAEADALDDIVELLEALYVLIGGILKTLQVLQDVRVINITQDTDVGLGTFVDTTPGTVTTEAVPQNAFGLILDTPRLASKGRKFFGPVTDLNYNEGGIIGAGALAAMGNVGDYMIVQQVATNNAWRFGVQSTLAGVGFLPFVGYGISPTVVTQRRRRIGVGI